MKKLSELEQRAREERAARIQAAEEKAAQEREAEERETEEFRQKVIAWMAEEGDLDATELQESLSVAEREYGRIKLSVPEHTSVIFQVTSRDGEMLGVRNGHFEVLCPDGGHDYTYANSLGDALLQAAERYQEEVGSQAAHDAWEAEREASRVQREAEAAERGEKYLTLLSAFPILCPVLDILGEFLEERERFANDLRAAEEWAGDIEVGLSEKLEQARYEADDYARERDRLQYDLYDAQDKLRKAERKARRGW